MILWMHWSSMNWWMRVQKCTTEVTSEYLQLISNHLQAVYSSCSTSWTRELHMYISLNILKTWRITSDFCRLRCALLLHVFYLLKHYHCNLLVLDYQGICMGGRTCYSRYSVIINGLNAINGLTSYAFISTMCWVCIHIAI